MHAVYVACLFGGAVATALFAVLGAIGGVGHGVHGHVGHATHGHVGQAAPGHTAVHAHAAHGHAVASHGHAASHAHAHSAGHAQPNGKATQPAARQATHAGSTTSSILGWTLSWVSPLTIAAAAMWFGAAGLLTESSVGRVALLVAIIAAIIGAFLIRAVMNAFIRASTPPLQSGAEGALATVNATIRPDAAGEVIYTLEGLTRSLPARSLDGSTLPRGTSVAIVKRERGIAWVAPLDSLSLLDEFVEGPDEYQNAETQRRGDAQRDG